MASDDEEDDVYEVEKILDYKRVDGEKLFRVRWVGYTSESDTWEPIENLSNCREVVRAFLIDRKRQKTLSKENDNTSSGQHKSKHDFETQSDSPNSAARVEQQVSSNNSEARTNDYLNLPSVASKSSTGDIGNVEEITGVSAKTLNLAFKIPKKFTTTSANADGSETSQKHSFHSRTDSEIQNSNLISAANVEHHSSFNKTDARASSHLKSHTVSSSSSDKDNENVEEIAGVPSKTPKLCFKIPKKSSTALSNVDSSEMLQKQGLSVGPSLSAPSRDKKIPTNTASQERTTKEKHTTSTDFENVTASSKNSSKIASDPSQKYSKPDRSKLVQRKRSFQAFSASSPPQQTQRDSSKHDREALNIPVTRTIKVSSKNSIIGPSQNILNANGSQMIRKQGPLTETMPSGCIEQLQTNSRKQSPTAKERKGIVVHSENAKDILKNPAESISGSIQEFSLELQAMTLPAPLSSSKQHIQSDGNKHVAKKIANPLSSELSANKPAKGSKKNYSNSTAPSLQNLTISDKQPIEKQKQVQIANAFRPLPTQSASNKHSESTAECYDFSMDHSGSAKVVVNTSTDSAPCACQDIEKPNDDLVQGSYATMSASELNRELSRDVSANKLLPSQQIPDAALLLSHQQTNSIKAPQQHFSESQTTDHLQTLDSDCNEQIDQCRSAVSDESAEADSRSLIPPALSSSSESVTLQNNGLTTKIQRCDPDVSTLHETSLLVHPTDGISSENSETKENGAFGDINENNKLLMQAAKAGNYIEIERIVTSGKCDLEQANENGTTLLMNAATCGFSDTVKALVLGGANINARHSRGSTALIQACKHGQFSTAVVLLALGAHLNCQTDEGNTALILASKFNYQQIVNELLLNGADFSVKSFKGKTALQYAEALSSSGVAKMIEEHINRVKKAFDLLINSTIANSAQIIQELFDLRCFALNEGTTFMIDFTYKDTGTLSKGFGMLLYLAHAIINEEEVKCRLHGKCAVHTVLLNGKKQFPLSEDGNYILSFCPVMEGRNRLIIKTDSFPNTQVKLLVHAYKVRLLSSSGDP